MYKTKNLIVAALFMIPLIHYGQHTDEINSNRPGETMSAFAVGKSVIQVETGIYGIKEEHSILNYDANGIGLDMTLRWGLFKEKLEFIADLQYQHAQFNSAMSSTQKSDFKQTVLGAKYLLYDPFKNYKKEVNVYSYKANHAFNWHQFIPAVSVFAGANIMLAGNPYYFSPDAGISPKIMLITQNHLGDGSFVFVTNIIADYIGTDYPSYGYVITLTKGLSQNWSAFVENQGYKSDFNSDFVLRGGAAYLLNKSMQIDASIGGSVKSTPSTLYGGVGFSWRYDTKYKEVKIDTDDKKGKDKGKGNDKSKKRKDAVETTPKK
ncbi:MAG: transporter [Bacteroidota bacterium]